MENPTQPTNGVAVRSIACSDDFAWWSNKRGVWPRLTHEETFQAGWESCATRLWEVCTTENESKEEFIHRIKAIISMPNAEATESHVGGERGRK